MRTIFIFVIFLSYSLFGLEIKIASYNVENLFDMNMDGSEYKEYIPDSKSKWNNNTYQIKLQHTAKAINNLNAHVIALQEIESQQAFYDLLELTPQYSHYDFVKNKGAAVGLAILSQYPISKNEIIRFKTKVNRPIQKVTLNIKNKNLIIFNNHWASKRNSESHRVNFALELQEELSTLSKNSDYIILGDLNSNYNEYETIKLEKRLNDTQGFTAINHGLNTLVNEQLITPYNIFKQNVRSHYNLWYELKFQERFSSQFRNTPQTPDNILLPQGLFDDKNFSYMNNSFQVFKPNYLYKDSNIKRWQIKQGLHIQKGFSDHLPIYAKFHLKAYEKKIKPHVKNIDDLYHIEQLKQSIRLFNVTVLYKHENHAIIKQNNGRSIFLYNCANALKEGFAYDLNVEQITTYHGLKEITHISHIHQKSKINKIVYTDATSIDLHQSRYQNELITKLLGTYKNGYLFYDTNKKIKLYSKNKSALPKNGQKITIISGHLAYFKNQAQIIVYKKSDIKVHF